MEAGELLLGLQSKNGSQGEEEEDDEEEGKKRKQWSISGKL